MILTRNILSSRTPNSRKFFGWVKKKVPTSIQSIGLYKIYAGDIPLEHQKVEKFLGWAKKNAYIHTNYSFV